MYMLVGWHRFTDTQRVEYAFTIGDRERRETSLRCILFDSVKLFIFLFSYWVFIIRIASWFSDDFERSTRRVASDGVSLIARSYLEARGRATTARVFSNQK